MHKQQGFTLIELMIVVAIIAILGVIAMTLLPDYTARAQLSEAIELAGGLKAPVTEAYVNAGDASSCAIPASAVTQGRYVLQIVAANGASDHCELVATMRTGINNKASGRTVSLAYTPSTGEWRCSSDAPVEAVPSACR